MSEPYKRTASGRRNALMLVTALVPSIGYDKAAQIAHHAMAHDLTLKEAALKLGFIGEEEFDKLIDQAKMAGLANS
jgi:fumarate hydratase class II